MLLSFLNFTINHVFQVTRSDQKLYWGRMVVRFVIRLKLGSLIYIKQSHLSVLQLA